MGMGKPQFKDGALWRYSYTGAHFYFVDGRVSVVCVNHPNFVCENIPRVQFNGAFEFTQALDYKCSARVTFLFGTVQHGFRAPTARHRRDEIVTAFA
jgi:hypothetical protein